MSRWEIPAAAADLHADALVWDMTLPIITPGTPERKAGLLRRGYAEKEIRGILGENWLRVCGEVWK